jgi:hypothetical protein
MSSISDEIEYKNICLKIQKGKATEKDRIRLDLVEARITMDFLLDKLKNKYNPELVNKIDSLSIRVSNLEKSWDIYNKTRPYNRAQ